ncbi:NUDIX domain-containing protein [Acinetobacter sp. R933-2]|uniref:NUDIX hydrolase n=1 Tax=Acinetobacter sp. R933-2 TaxID=2746728 RepID=UPI00257907A1|nr:NUDIX domain-containing protein [Acinetobacter sp. R933-2]MDM1248098.1 NUDIX domain-containing protein [Acinetobacter sp. R933-2]
MSVITVAATIILNEQNQLLLVRKKNTDFFMQVGGKLEENEAPERTMLREITEEIDAKADIQQFIGRFETRAANEAGHQLVSYVYHVILEQAPRINAEIVEMKWIALDHDPTWLAPLTNEIVIPWCLENIANISTL